MISPQRSLATNLSENTLDQKQNRAARLCENIENQGYTNSQTCMGRRATMFTSDKDITNQSPCQNQKLRRKVMTSRSRSQLKVRRG